MKHYFDSRCSNKSGTFYSGGGGGVMFVMILFNLRAFMLWFAIDNIIPGNFGFAVQLPY